MRRGGIPASGTYCRATGHELIFFFFFTTKSKALTTPTVTTAATAAAAAAATADATRRATKKLMLNVAIKDGYVQQSCLPHGLNTLCTFIPSGS